MQQGLWEHIKHIPHPPPSIFVRGELMNYFYQKICARCWIIRGDCTDVSAFRELAEQLKKTKKRQSDLIPSSLAIARGLRHDPDGPCVCFTV